VVSIAESLNYRIFERTRIALQLALFANRQAKANTLSWQDIFARIADLPKFR
jgi:hypothetical protein